MKTLLSLLGGAMTVTEQGGVVSLNLDASIGGGQAAGVIKGQGSFLLDANMGIKLGEALLNAHLPASVQALAPVLETVINQAIDAIE